MKSLDKINLFFTLGDLAGIGPEIFFKFTKGLKQLNQQEWEFQENIKIILVDEINTIRHSLSLFQAGKPSKFCGEHSFQTLIKANHLCLNTPNSYLITGPVSKESLALANHKFSGQTEALAHINNLTAKDVEMLFIARDFRIILATRHIPLAAVPTQLKNNLLNVLTHSINIMQEIFKIRAPRIGLTSLNPHAGENGLIGSEELDWMNKISEDFSSYYPESFISKASAADSLLAEAGKCFLKNQKPYYDLYVSAYHDQCLPLIKCIAGYQAINMTYGLPYIRVSVDHGCAFDIAGKNIADHSALIACAEFCANIAKNLKQHLKI